MDIKSFIKDSAEREKGNHRIVNIMMVALFSLVIIFTLCFGVRVNIGSAYFDDGKDAYVRQNIFQVIDVVLDNNMTQAEAVVYVEKVNSEIKEKYGVDGFIVTNPYNGENPNAFNDLGKFDDLVARLGNNASKVNLLKYKFAYAVAIGNVEKTEHIQSEDGSRIFSMIGQFILMMVAQLALVVIALVMLIFAVLALIKNKKFNKAKFALILLMIVTFFNIVLFSSASFVSMNWAGVMVIVLIMLCTVAYALIQHAMMDRSKLSMTMLIHNGVMLGGGLLALILFLSPIFKFTSPVGATQSIGWAYLMDYTLASQSYMSAVMAYTLTEVLMLLLIMLPASLMIAFILINLSKFLSADYHHNEKKIFMIVILALDALIFLLLCIYSSRGDLDITNLNMTVRLSIATVVFQILTLGGMLAFEILYKVKPVKRELLIK